MARSGVEPEGFRHNYGMAKSFVVVLLTLSLTTHGAAEEATNRDRSDYTEMPARGFPVRLDPVIVPAARASLKDVEMVSRQGSPVTSPRWARRPR